MLRKTNLGEINPLRLDKESEMYLTTFLQQHPKSVLFSKNKSYSFQFCRPGENIALSYEFKLTHDILVRPRKESKASKELRYEVLANRPALGSGSFGSVLLSEGVLKNKLKVCDRLFKPHPRAIKLIEYDPLNPHENNIAAAKVEYKNSSKTPHLHMKPPVVATFESQRTKTKPSAYLVMRLMRGKNLQHFIEEEAYGNIRLSTTQRLHLSLEILRKIKEQAHDVGLIHRDLKAENIMAVINPLKNHANQAVISQGDVDDIFPNGHTPPSPTEDPRDVNLVDFSFSKIIDDPESDPGAMGSIITMPPEQFICAPEDMPAYSEASDSYAAGKTLAELWRAKPEANLEMDDYRSLDQAYIGFFRYAQYDTNFDFTNFLTDDLSDDHAAAIKDMLMQLTKAHPKDRWSIDAAIKLLESIQDERQNQASKRSQVLG